MDAEDIENIKNEIGSSIRDAGIYIAAAVVGGAIVLCLVKGCDDNAVTVKYENTPLFEQLKEDVQKLKKGYSVLEQRAINKNSLLVEALKEENQMLLNRYTLLEEKLKQEQKK